MFTVDATNADIPFSYKLGEITDAEGNPVGRDQVLVQALSNNEAAVSFVEVEDTDTGIKGKVRFGTVGPADLRVETRDKDEPDQLLGSDGAQFNVVAGNPEAVTSGTLEFEGLTEDAPAPVEEPPVE